jgi:septum formation protein
MSDASPSDVGEISRLPTPRLILASASPRRELLLREAGYMFVIDPADVDEEDHPADLAPGKLALLLARRKADVVAARHPRDVVLAADTVVAVGGQILGKPHDRAHARQMLSQLSGTTHQVITAVAVARNAPLKISREVCVISTVQMRQLSTQEIEDYVQSEAWRGKAGGYGIQDRDPFVTRMSGSLTNIVGLPMDETAELLEDAGISAATRRAKSDIS